MDGNEACLMAWEDLNTIIGELRTVLDTMDTEHPDLHAFKAPIARAIASMRADRAHLELTPGANLALLARHSEPQIVIPGSSSPVSFPPAGLPAQLQNDLIAVFSS
jgi:hypothetical protein